MRGISRLSFILCLLFLFHPDTVIYGSDEPEEGSFRELTDALVSIRSKPGGLRQDSALDAIRILKQAGSKQLSELDARREELVKRRVPATALEKFDAAVSRAHQRYNRLESLLTKVSNGVDGNPAEELAKELSYLDDFVADRPFDPSLLTWSRPDVPTREPEKGTPSESVSMSPPTEEDLAETVDAPFTPGIRELAARLDHNPVKIFNWVRNNIDYLPVYGSFKGADYTLLTHEGTDFDQASLLIALLRVSGVPCRYICGTMEIPEADICSWLDVTDLKAAGDVLVTSGVPASIVGTVENPQLRMERCWVLAYVNDAPTRGLLPGEGDAWVPLDPSYKRYDRIPAKIDLPPPDAVSFVNDIIDSGTTDEAGGFITNVDTAKIESQLQGWLTTSMALVEAQDPDATALDLTAQRRIVQVDNNVLPAAPAFAPTGVLLVFSTIPDGYRYKIKLELGDRGGFIPIYTTEFSVTKWLPEIAGKRITLSTITATADDQALLESFFPVSATASWEEYPVEFQTAGIDVVPRFMIDGTIEGIGAAKQMGTKRELHLTYVTPETGATRKRTEWMIQNDVWMGGTYAIALDLGNTPQEAAQDRFRRLQSTERRLEYEPLGNFTGELLGGERLFATAVDYLAESDIMKRTSSQNYNVIDCGYLGEAIVFLPMRVLSPLGAPKIRYEGISIDVDLSLEIVTDRGGDSSSDSIDRFMTTAGSLGSGMESEIFETLIPREPSDMQAVSTVRILRAAAEQGIPIYTVTPENRNTTVPQLSLPSSVITDIQNSAAAGRHVTVPKTTVTIDDYVGIGYIVSDPDSGAASYLIAGGLSGGYSRSAAFDRLGMLMNGDFDGFIDAIARGVRDMIRNRPLEFVAVPLAKTITLLLLYVVFPPIGAALELGGLAAIFWRLVIVNIVGEIIAAIARL